MSSFFDKAKHDMGKYLKAAEIKAAELAESTKINLEIYSLKKEKDKVLLSVGRTVYKMFKKGQFDSARIEKECKAAARIDEEIKKVREKERYIHREAKRAYKYAHEGKSYRERDRRREWSDKNPKEEDGGAEEE